MYNFEILLDRQATPVRSTEEDENYKNLWEVVDPDQRYSSLHVYSYSGRAGRGRSGARCDLCLVAL